MAARPSMIQLVGRLRSHTGANTDDLFHGVTYWSEDQLQDALDGFRYDLWAARLTPVARKIDGSTVYLQYTFAIPRGFWVEDLFVVRNAAGGVLASPTYSVEVNDQQGTVTFDSDPGEQDLALDLSVFDWNAAAAAVWEQKAAHRSDYINFKAADHKFDAEAEYRHCVDRMEWHRARRVRSFHRPSRGFVTATANASRSRR